MENVQEMENDQRDSRAGDSSLSVLAREAAAACDLLGEAAEDELEAAKSLVMDRVGKLLQAVGWGIHPVRGVSGKVRGDQPAFRVETSVDYVIRDVRHAAGIARSRARNAGRGLCTEEPLESDPQGVLIDLLDLEVPMSELTGVVDVLRFTNLVRGLTASERGQAWNPLHGQTTDSD